MLTAGEFNEPVRRRDNDAAANPLMFRLFALVNLVSALLVFSVQPLISKMLLPRFGGSAMVWLAALMFFQGGLLLGYLYAHLLATRFSPAAQARLHTAVIAAACLFLPVGAATEMFASWPPALAVAAVLGVSVGLPYLVVCATSPLSQRWYAASDSAGRDPYLLYAIGNIGSLAALLAYPALIEPNLGSRAQGWLWSSVFLLLVGTMLSFAWLGPARHPATAEGPRYRSNWRQRLTWSALAYVPSLYLMGTTLHVSLDIAAAPFLWVLPLALYLASFVIGFARPGLWLNPWLLGSHAVVLILLTVYFYAASSAIYLVLHLVGLLLTGVVGHCRLAAARPQASDGITDFYIWVALGGFLGGVCGALIAPALFSTNLEYPLAIAAACLLWPRRAPSSWFRDLSFAAGLALAVAVFQALDGVSEAAVDGHYLVLAAVLFWFRKRPLRVALAVLLLLLSQAWQDGRNTTFAARNFYGIYKVRIDESIGVKYLTHGTTIHGSQSTHPALRRQALAYYNEDGPLGEVMQRLSMMGRRERLGVIGLGAGALACYVEPGGQAVFFEIDPLMVDIARNEFTYLSHCAPGAQIEVVDGRLGVASLSDASLDVLVVDAFSSDAIPLHLLTREALALYLRKLRPVGVVLFHVSNRHVDLTPVIAAAATAAGVRAHSRRYDVTEDDHPGVFDSDWIAVSRSGWPGGIAGWQSASGEQLWTDDYSDLFSVVDWRRVVFR